MVIDTELTLDMMRAQLRWMEREMAALRQLVEKAPIPQGQEPFERLAGVWKEISFSDEDFQSSRLKISKDI